MADISDVEDAIANVLTDILYPEGSSQASIVGALCRVYRGWPNAGTLNSDLSAGVVNVTVVSDNDSGRTTTRYLPEWQTVTAIPGAIVTASGQTITIAGNPAVGDVVGILVDGSAYSYRAQESDSVFSIASNLALAIQANRPALAQGFTVVVPGAGSIVARAVTDQAASFESRRQEKDVRIVCWCPAPPVRDTVTAAIDLAINRLPFLVLPDNTSARIVYRNTASYDQAQNALLYRRDLIYLTEYATVLQSNQPSMVFGASNINGDTSYG